MTCIEEIKKVRRNEKLPKEKDKNVLKDSPKEKNTARGLYQESKISLYALCYDGKRQASVFIYPAEYPLDREKIITISPRFTSIIEEICSKEFKDASMEDVSAAFLREIKPLIPFMSNEYRMNKPRILEHSFVKDSEVYIRGVIEDLKV